MKGSDILIGDTRLEIAHDKVISMKQKEEIFKMFGMIDNPYMIARKLIEMNNEVYDKLHCNKCGCALHNDLCMDCAEYENTLRHD